LEENGLYCNESISFSLVFINIDKGIVSHFLLNPPLIPPFRRGTSFDVIQEVERSASSFVKEVADAGGRRIIELTVKYTPELLNGDRIIYTP